MRGFIVLFIFVALMFPQLVFGGVKLPAGQVDRQVAIVTRDDADYDYLAAPSEDLTVANVTMTTAGVEYTYALPTSAKAYSLQVRDATDVRIAYLTGDVSESGFASATGPYFTVKSGSVFTVDKLDLASDLTIFMAVTPTGNKVAEIAIAV